MPEVQDETVEGASDVVYSAICSHHVQCDNRGATCGKNARRVLTTQIRSFAPDICLKTGMPFGCDRKLHLPSVIMARTTAPSTPCCSPVLPASKNIQPNRDRGEVVTPCGRFWSAGSGADGAFIVDLPVVMSVNRELRDLTRHVQHCYLSNASQSTEFRPSQVDLACSYRQVSRSRAISNKPTSVSSASVDSRIGIAKRS